MLQAEKSHFLTFQSSLLNGMNGCDHYKMCPLIEDVVSEKHVLLNTYYLQMVV